MDLKLHGTWKRIYRGGRLVAMTCACGCGRGPLDFLRASDLRSSVEATNQPATGT